jgi:hypothetical protein
MEDHNVRHGYTRDEWDARRIAMEQARDIRISYDDLREQYEQSFSPMTLPQSIERFLANHRRERQERVLGHAVGAAAEARVRNPDEPSVVPAAIVAPEEKPDEPSAPEGTPEKKLCVICIDRAKVVALIPCGHVCLCATCTVKAAPKTCPMCRAHVTSTLRVFM